MLTNMSSSHVLYNEFWDNTTGLADVIATSNYLTTNQKTYLAAVQDSVVAAGRAKPGQVRTLLRFIERVCSMRE